MTALTQTPTSVRSPEIGSASTRWRTLSAWAGIAFVPIFVAGIFMSARMPGDDASDAKFTAWYSDSTNRTVALVGAYLLIVAALLFLAFAAGLQERLRPARAQSPVGYRMVAWTATLFASLTVVGALLLVAIVGNIAFGGTAVPSADLLRQNYGYPLIFVGGAVVAALHIAVVATIARRAGLFPTWLVALSFVFAVLLLLAVVFTPMAALPLWALTVGIVLLVRSGSAHSAT
jgi:hypothetical protein